MNNLMKNENEIIRILQTKEDRVLVIDCIKATMPKWISLSEINNYVDGTEEEVCERTNVELNRELKGEERKVAQERFTLIAALLPCIGDEKHRSYMIETLSG